MSLGARPDSRCARSRRRRASPASPVVADAAEQRLRGLQARLLDVPRRPPHRLGAPVCTTRSHLSDARRVAPEKLLTILRQPVTDDAAPKP
jgi:hypothetical protein